MASYPLRALVLRKTKLGETDVIVTLLAEDGRQVRAVAKGLRKPGSRIGARLEPYSVVDLLLNTGRSLEIVTEVRSVETHAVIREDLDRGAAAAVVADVLDKISLEGQPEERLFGLACATLDELATARVTAVPVLTVGFLVKAMAMHGYRPQLDACVLCGADAGTSAAFSLVHGGTVCSACLESDPSALVLHAPAREWLGVLLRSTMAEMARMDVPDAAVRDCFTLMRAFVAYHLPTRLKALDFYASMVG